MSSSMNKIHNRPLLYFITPVYGTLTMSQSPITYWDSSASKTLLGSAFSVATGQVHLLYDI